MTSGNNLPDHRKDQFAEELANITTVKQYVQDLRCLLNESPLAERKSFMKSCVKEVRVAGDKALFPPRPCGRTKCFRRQLIF